MIQSNEFLRKYLLEKNIDQQSPCSIWLKCSDCNLISVPRLCLGSMLERCTNKSSNAPHSLISILLPAAGKYVQVRHTMQCQRGFKGLLSSPWNVRFLTRRSQPNTKAKGEKAGPERIEQGTEREENGNQNDQYAISTGGPRWLFQRISAFLHSWHGFGLCWMPWRNETQISESVLSCRSEAGSYLGIHCTAGNIKCHSTFLILYNEIYSWCFGTRSYLRIWSMVTPFD